MCDGKMPETESTTNDYDNIFPVSQADWLPAVDTNRATLVV